jgi:uncharacterized protein (TIGR00255 family)
MIVSMTGFAAATAELPGVSLSVELRAVNHRYLDVSVKLSDELRALEPALRERIASEVKRGKVECRLSLARAALGSASSGTDQARIRELAALADEVRRSMPAAAPITTAEVLRWPGVLVEPTVAPDVLAERAMSLVSDALRELRAARSREGEKLAAILRERLVDIEAQLARAAPRIPAVYSAYLDKLGARLREAGLDPNDERLKQELALFATKIDVAEEMARLATHVSEFRRALAQGGSVGKRLDFLAQELNREANTLGSKSVDTELSQSALELKVLIEQMREQVQNLE